MFLLWFFFVYFVELPYRTLCVSVCISAGHVWYWWGGLPVSALRAEQHRCEQRSQHDPDGRRGVPAQEERRHSVGHPEGPEGHLNTPVHTHSHDAEMPVDTHTLLFWRPPSLLDCIALILKDSTSVFLKTASFTSTSHCLICFHISAASCHHLLPVNQPTPSSVKNTGMLL